MSVRSRLMWHRSLSTLLVSIVIVFPAVIIPLLAFPEGCDLKKAFLAEALGLSALWVLILLSVWGHSKRKRRIRFQHYINLEWTIVRMAVKPFLIAFFGALILLEVGTMLATGGFVLSGIPLMLLWVVTVLTLVATWLCPTFLIWTDTLGASGGCGTCFG